MSYRNFFVLLMLTVLASFTPAQEPKPTVTPSPAGDGANGPVAPLPRQPLTWQRLSNADQDFAVELPSNAKSLVDSEPFSLDSDGKIVCSQWRTESSYVDGVVMMIELYSVNKPKEALDLVAGKLVGGPQEGKQSIRNNDVAGQAYTATSIGITYQRQYFPLKNAVLMAMTISKDAAHPLAQHFWKSLRVGLAKKPAALQPAPVEADPLAAVKLDWDEQAILTAKNVTQKAVLTWRPTPPYTDRARRNNIVGTVTIRALLGANGQVLQTFALTRLPHGLTEMALAAAKRVKFFPAAKDDKAVSQWVQIEYSFNLY